MVTSRRTWIRGSLALAFAGALAVFLFRPALRRSAFDDSDLAPPPIDAPLNASNAVWLLDRAARQWPLDEDSLAQSRRELSAPQPLPALTREAIAPSSNLLSTLRAASAAPLAAHTNLAGFFDAPSDSDPWQSLAVLAALHIRARLDDGRTAEAVDIALTVARLGQRLENAGGSVLDGMRGRRFADLAIAQLVQSAPHLAPRDPALLPAIHGLLDCGAHRVGLSNVVKLDYQRTLADLRAMKRGRLPGASNSLPVPLPNLFLDLNQVRQREAAIARFTLRHLHSPLTEIPFGELQRWHSPTSLLRSVVRGNAIGSALLDLNLESPRRLLQSAASADARTRLAATLLALRAHESRGHGLPTHLAELVPEFLPAVPLDPFDHHPLRFDRSRRLLWSIGRDLVDDQGRKRDRQDRDATFDEVVAIPWPP